MSLEEIERELAELKKEQRGILELLQTILDPEVKMTLNLTAENLTVYANLQKQQLTKNFDTSTANGRILACAVEDLKGAAFAESELSACLAERGWPSSHGAVAPALSRLADDNLLIREGTSPVKYRIPGKIVVNVKEV